MSMANTIFLVSTPEIPALHLARLRMQRLNEMGLAERATILVNRVEDRMPLSISELEAAIGGRVRFRFPNQYEALNSAIGCGTPLSEDTPLGTAVSSFALWLSGGSASSVQRQPRHRFLEFFSPSRFTRPAVRRRRRIRRRRAPV